MLTPAGTSATEATWWPTLCFQEGSIEDLAESDRLGAGGIMDPVAPPRTPRTGRPSTLPGPGDLPTAVKAFHAILDTAVPTPAAFPSMALSPVAWSIAAPATRQNQNPAAPTN
jgi:hypothetical protein